MTRRRTARVARRRATIATAALLLAGLSPAAEAHEAADRCRQLGLLVPICTNVERLERGIQRTGVSVADYTDNVSQVVEIADFYFAPRIIQVFDESRVVFVNRNPEGGNRHSISSSDFGADERILPAPGFEFGAGRGFRSSAKLMPGDAFVLDIDIASMDPAAYLPTGFGDYYIGYHCYVHGASQMSGLIRVLPRG